MPPPCALSGKETDLRFSVQGRTWIVGDGKFNMPDGEIHTAPVTSTIDGQIYFEYPGVLGGRLMHDIRLRWEMGRLVEATASTNQDYLQSIVRTDAGASLIGEFAFGTNPYVTAFTKDILIDEKIGGTVHIALGRAYPESGGDNRSAIHWDIIKDIRREGAVYVDGPAGVGGRRSSTYECAGLPDGHRHRHLLLQGRAGDGRRNGRGQPCDAAHASRCRIPAGWSRMPTASGGTTASRSAANCWHKAVSTTGKSLPWGSAPRPRACCRSTPTAGPCGRASCTASTRGRRRRLPSLRRSWAPKCCLNATAPSFRRSLPAPRSSGCASTNRQVWAKTHLLLGGAGYLVYRLTGEAVLDIYDAGAYAPLFDVRDVCLEP